MNPAGFAAALSATLTHDIAMSNRARRREQAHFEKVRRAETQYGVQLRKIARHVGEIINSFPIGDPGVVSQLIDVLTKYSVIIEPWARAAAARMLAEVSRRDEAAWFRTSRIIGRELRKEIYGTDLGEIFRQLVEDQVHYIKSIPIEAARDVQAKVVDYMAGGRRYENLVQDLADQTGITVSRATLIARTETAKAHALITQARATSIKSPGYIWRTARDYRVRKKHKELEGSLQKWDDPPEAEENGDKHHPGMFPNCRCWAEPIIPDIIT